MSATTPVVDVAAKTVTHEGKTYKMNLVGDDAYQILVNGVALGRVIYSFGAVNPVVESPDITEDELTAIGEAWFAALPTEA